MSLVCHFEIKFPIILILYGAKNFFLDRIIDDNPSLTQLRKFLNFPIFKYSIFYSHICKSTTGQNCTVSGFRHHQRCKIVPTAPNQQQNVKPSLRKKVGDYFTLCAYHSTRDFLKELQYLGIVVREHCALFTLHCTSFLYFPFSFYCKIRPFKVCECENMHSHR